MHPHRRRKKRPNYETRTVEINRGQNGFGFTISGQQPCILSCIVSNSPADSSGLRAGDFLISVNGSNVCKSPHDTVVQLIGNSTGSIRMTIAENYFSDSSEDELASNSRATNCTRNRPKYPHKSKNVRNLKFNQGPKSCKFGSNVDRELTSYRYKQSVSGNSADENCNGIVCKPLSSSWVAAQNMRPGPSSVKNLGFQIDVTDVSCSHNRLKIKESIPCKDRPHTSPPSCSETSKIQHYENSSVSASLRFHQLPTEKETVVEYRAIVGYLGTIEMPKQIATSSKLQTVRSCIRKLRQEKRSPTTVLMTILPSCMTLKNNMGNLLAEYPSKRVNYVSCSSENDYRFFGLVTCATHQVEFTKKCTITESEKDLMGVSISNSCHVFVIDSKMVEHCNHIGRAKEFNISCCVDPVSNTCLEFPNNAEYIVNIIRMMYSLKVPNGYSIYGKEIDSVLQLTKKSSSPISNANFARHLNRAPVRVGRYPRLTNRICVREENGEKGNKNYRINHQNDNFGYEIEPAQNNGNDVVANSPQPSNHSEITTASSNSDSGIGFHNDCQNISDRILVVDFSNPQNNFNVNAPHFGNNFIPRSSNMGVNRENKLRPIGIAGAAAFDMDSSFLSNTTPVVEGFGGQGRPLNHIDHVLLGNVDETSQAHAIFNANIMNISSESKTVAEESDKSNTDHCLPCNSNMVNKSWKNISSPTFDDDHILNVRAMPEQYGYNHLPCTSNWDSKFHLSPNKQCDTSSITYDELPFDVPHTYDSVYTETEDHHYEMIKPKNDFGINEEFYVTPEKTENATYIKKQGIDMPSLSKRSSNCTESLEDVTVISAKSQDYIHNNRNASIDDISMYSSKSQDYVSPNSSKNKIKKLQSSVDDILIFGLKNCNSTDVHREVEDHMFLHPSSIKTKLRKSIKPYNILSKTRQMLTSREDKREKAKKDALSSYRLSPKVFGVTQPSVSVDNLCAVADDSDKENMNNDDWKTCESWMTGHLEGTSSEPDLRYKSNDKPLSSEHASPFRRWAGGSSGGAGEGGARDRVLVHRSYRRPTSLVAAAAASDHDMYAKSDGTNVNGSKANNNNLASGGVAAWSLGLEHLLADPDGASAFAAFLAKEFSAENIRFWTACERYAKSSCPDEARSIFDRHLADRAPEPVNVDSHARTLAAKRLEEAPADLFTQAQKQIFNLMKFDSYPRFLRSDVHAECARSELRGEKSPYAVSSSKDTPNKLKKSLSNVEERRRGTILPWARARLRVGSKDRQQHAVPVPTLTTTPTDNKGPNLNVATSPTTPSDLSPLESMGIGASCSLCRISLPDHAATTVVAVDDTNGQTIRQLIDRLLDKRGISCVAYDVFEQGVTKALDVSMPSSCLGGRRVCVERRVVFRLELPNRRAVSVRCRPSKRLAAVLKPVLLRYCGPLATSRSLAVSMHGTALDLDTTVQVADGQRLQVTLNDDLAQNLSQSTGGLQMPSSAKCRPEIQPQCSQGPGSRQGQGPVPSLDEITNRVFEEVLQGKQELQFEKSDGSVKSENCNSEHSSGIYGQYAASRQRQAAGGYAGSSGASSGVGAPGGIGALDEGGRPLVAKLRAGVRVQAVGTQRAADSNDFLENLRQTQKALLKTSYPSMSSNTTKFASTTCEDARNGNIEKQTTIIPPVPAARNLTNRNNITKPSPAARTIISTANTKSHGPANNSDCLANKSNSDEDNTMNMPLQFLNFSYSMSKSALNSLENNETSPSDTTFCIEVGSTERQSNCAGKENSGSSTVNDINCTSRVIEPPPLPPKPKVLPTKPSNWGHNLTGENVASNIIQDVNLPEQGRNKRMIYLDQPTSSFV